MRLGGLQLDLLAAIERMNGQAWADPLKVETGTLHIAKALIALRHKGLIERRWFAPRGCKRRRYYKVTGAGRDVRKETVEAASGGGS